MRKFLFILNILIFSTSFSQELINTLNLELDKKTESFHVFDDKTKTTGLFLFDKENIKCILLDENLNAINTISTSKLDKKYKSLMSYGFNDNVFALFWKDNKSKNIGAQIFDFNTNKVTLKNYEINLEGEQIINTLTIGGKFYLISINKLSSILNIYTFEENLSKKIISYENKKFLNFENRPVTLHNLINEKLISHNGPLIQNILADTPPSLVLSAQKKKCYIKNNNIIFSFDNSKSFTQTIYINLESFESNQVIYEKPYVKETDFNFVDSNSFIFDDKIIQMKLNYDKMLVSIKSLANKELKTFEINDNEEINISNTDIIQENGSYKNKRILEKSNKLLRKINSNYPSVSIYKKGEHYLLTLGGVSPIKDKYYVTYGAIIGGFTGAVVGALLSNYSIENINSYNNRKVVYINCVIDKDLNSVSGKINDTPFDKLRIFRETANLKNEIAYKLDSNLIYAGYDVDRKEFLFYKF